MSAWTYIMASQTRGTIYIGVTTDLLTRSVQHREGRGSDFTARYRCRKLVWFEEFHDVSDAIMLEKRMKEWRRAWKIEAIEKVNPDWDDLSYSLL